MELQAKPDLQQCLDRVEAFWDRQVLDRPPVTLNVRGEKPRRETPSHHASVRERKMDVAYVLDVVEADVEADCFLAERFPKYYPNLGPEVCATCYGAELVIAESTSWSKPCVRGIRDVLDLEPDLDTEYWRVIRELTDASLSRGAGKWITGLTDLHTNGDLLAALREPQDFAMDFLDDPEGVRLACRHVAPHFSAFFDDLYAPIAAAGQPCSTWGIAVSRRPMYYVNCDFICMISAEMFAETILPAIEIEMQRLERTIFHLDGPGALQHLDLLLALDDLDAIQWVYGAGNGPAARWIDFYKRVQDAGKGNEVHAADMDDARTIMDHLRPEGTWLCVGGSYSPEEARAILSEVARWAEGKR